ncbi:hypothetical protein SRHO_G00255440 [Serrasalmus rhombeus]
MSPMISRADFQSNMLMTTEGSRRGSSEGERELSQQGTRFQKSEVDNNERPDYRPAVGTDPVAFDSAGVSSSNTELPPLILEVAGIQMVCLTLSLLIKSQTVWMEKGTLWHYDSWWLLEQRGDPPIPALSQDLQRKL